MTDYIYIIMCGGDEVHFETPRQLLKFEGEPIVARTIRLLQDRGIVNIAISSNDERFEGFGVRVLHHDNPYKTRGYNDSDGDWCDCFYPTDEPACYICGDVVFSKEAIDTIIDTEVEDIMLFGSAPPFARNYCKPWEEPFAFKVNNQEHLHQAIEDVKRLTREGRFNREPIAWEVWNVISRGADVGMDVNTINYRSYVAINDWTCDIDKPDEISLLETMSNRSKW